MKELTIMEEHLSEVEQRTSRITELNRGIENDIEKLNTLKGNYKQSVANDLDDVDNLYHEMNDLERKIEADKHKLATLKDVTDEHLKKSALSVLSTFGDFHEGYKSRGELIEKELEKAKQDYINQARKIKESAEELQSEFDKEGRKYGQLMRDHKLTKEEVNNVTRNKHHTIDDSLYGSLPPVVRLDYEINDTKGVYQ